MTAVHATFVMERTYPHPVDKVFAAFAQPELRARWQNPPGTGHPDNQITFEFALGGRETNRWVMGDETPFPGAVMTSEGLFLDIVPQGRIAMANNMMMNGTPFSASLMTFEFEAAAGGTRLVCTHHGAFFENADGPEMRQDGWRQLLDLLGDSL